MKPDTVRIISRLSTLIGVLWMLAMAFNIGPLETMPMVFIASAFILVGAMLPGVFKKTNSDDQTGQGSQSSEESAGEEG